jgi:hypothetical protein
LTRSSFARGRKRCCALPDNRLWDRRT